MTYRGPNSETTSLYSFGERRFAFVLMYGVVINWFVFFAVTLWIGGDAIGTTPSTQGFVVTSHGRTTAVSEGVWKFALYYPLATLTLSPAIILLISASELHRVPRPVGIIGPIFVLIWCVVWCAAFIRDGSQSIRDYRAMKARMENAAIDGVHAERVGTMRNRRWDRRDARMNNQGPDSTAVRVALWRSQHVEVDALPHVFVDEVGLRLAPEDEDWRQRPDMDAERMRLFRASIVGRRGLLRTWLLSRLLAELGSM